MHPRVLGVESDIDGTLTSEGVVTFRLSRVAHTVLDVGLGKASVRISLARAYI